MIIVAGLLLAGGWATHSMRGAPIAGTGWVAKRTCSGVFVAGRAPATLVEARLPIDLPFTIETEIDRRARTVTAFYVGPAFAPRLAPSTARFRPGLGCTLEGPSPGDPALDRITSNPAPPIPPRSLLPLAPPTPSIEGVLDDAFADSRGGEGTRAVVILQNGRIVAERYAEGFSPDTPLPGWSMTKSVTNALVGLLVDARRIDLHAPVALDLWRGPGDPRAEITWDQLLRMSSGLAFSEDYATPSSDAIQMLLGRARVSKGEYAASRPLEYPIDTHWSYASGTTNVIQYAILERVFAGDLETYLGFPRTALFQPLGMTSAVMEPDGRGAFVGSSFMFATARDWARFGQLFLDDGQVDQQPLLSREWIRYSATPTPTEPRGTYGAHWWLNADPEVGTRRWPGLPANLLVASGFEGQNIVIVPDARLVVVRLGLDRAERFDIARFVRRVLDALPR